jgi:glycosyltransferase involved in cell wall biosynthesis
MLKPHVLFVGPDNNKGGIGAVLNVYSKYFNDFQLIKTYPSDVSRNRVIYFLKSLFSLVQKLLKDKSINVVHIHSASNGSFLRKSIVLLISKSLTRKVILHIHGGSFKEFFASSRIRSKYILTILKMSDAVICLSEEWKYYFNNQLGLNNVKVLSNPIEYPELANREKESDQLELLFLGAVVPTKGIFDLLEYLSTNKYFITGRIRLHIGGEGDSYHLNKLLQQYGISDSVIQHGWVENEEKSSLMNMIDIFILPSHIEALPMSILEAMSYAKPIISTRVGGIPSLVKEEYNGWLYNPSQIQQLDIIFDEIFADKAKLQIYGNNSRAEALKYDIRTVAAKLNSIYTDVLKLN